MRYPPIDCAATCPAEWVWPCIKTDGHASRHRDWTGRTWTDKEIARLEAKEPEAETPPPGGTR
jgi:hypothetical protein